MFSKRICLTLRMVAWVAGILIELDFYQDWIRILRNHLIKDGYTPDPREIKSFYPHSRFVHFPFDSIQHLFANIQHFHIRHLRCQKPHYI